MNRATIDLWVGIFVTFGMAAGISGAQGRQSRLVGNDPTYSVRADRQSADCAGHRYAVQAWWLVA